MTRYIHPFLKLEAGGTPPACIELIGAGSQLMRAIQILQSGFRGFHLQFQTTQKCSQTPPLPHKGIPLHLIPVHFRPAFIHICHLSDIQQPEIADPPIQFPA